MPYRMIARIIILTIVAITLRDHSTSLEIKGRLSAGTIDLSRASLTLIVTGEGSGLRIPWLYTVMVWSEVAPIPDHPTTEILSSIQHRPVDLTISLVDSTRPRIEVETRIRAKIKLRIIAETIAQNRVDPSIIGDRVSYTLKA